MLSENIMLLREHSGLTKTAMAKYLNLTLQGYSTYESGRNIPPADTLVKLADFFHVSVDFLLDRKTTGMNTNGEINFSGALTQAILSDLISLSMQQQKKVLDYIRLLKIESEQHKSKPHIRTSSVPPNHAPAIAAHGGGVKIIDEEIAEDLKKLGDSLKNNNKG